MNIILSFYLYTSLSDSCGLNWIIIEISQNCSFSALTWEKYNNKKRLYRHTLSHFIKNISSLFKYL